MCNADYKVSHALTELFLDNVRVELADLCADKETLDYREKKQQQIRAHQLQSVHGQHEEWTRWCYWVLALRGRNWQRARYLHPTMTRDRPLTSYRHSHRHVSFMPRLSTVSNKQHCSSSVYQIWQAQHYYTTLLKSALHSVINPVMSVLWTPNSTMLCI